MILNILLKSQKEIVLFLLILAISVIAVVVSQAVWNSSKETLQSAQSDLDYARERYYTAIDRKRLLALYEKKYQTLINNGIVGDEKRLNWVNVIESATVRFQIPYIKYRIEKRQVVSSIHLSSRYPDIKLFKSPMTFEMQLLHEGDLFSIINHLDKEVKGLFDIQSCSISRNHGTAISLLDSTTGKNFTALCKLNWYTMQQQTAIIPNNDNDNEQG